MTAFSVFATKVGEGQRKTAAGISRVKRIAMEMAIV